MILLWALLPHQEVEFNREPLQEVRAAVEGGKAALLDVRESAEWDQGHLKAARLFPLSVLKTASAGDVEKAVPKGVVYLHCRAGARALTAARILKDHGYDARPLKPGFEELRRAGFEAAR
jgi:phage shock protein E